MNPADSFNFQLKNTYKLEKSEGKKIIIKQMHQTQKGAILS